MDKRGTLLHHPFRMSSAPTLSIVIVNWNTRDLLLKVLGQLFDAPRFETEVLVVDNQSSDDSVAAAQRAFPAARVLPQTKNGGFAFGVNRGLEAANGRWILLLNTDAEVDWQQLERFVQAAVAENATGIFGPRILDEHGATQRSTWRRHRPRHYLANALFLARFTESPQREDAGDVDCVSGCVFLIHRDVLKDTGGFDERFFMYFEEADFCERARQAGHVVRFLPTAIFLHVGGLSAAQSAKRTFLAFRESTLLYHVQWHGRVWSEYIRLCLMLGHLIRFGIWGVMFLFGKRGRVGLYGAALAKLLNPMYVGQLCKLPRRIPPL